MPDSPKAEITRILADVESGDKGAFDRLLPVVYDELKRLAKARMQGQSTSQTLQPTALVHEAYIRLIGDEAVAWQSRGHFFAAAALAMRHILVDRARRRSRARRGGDRQRVELQDAPATAEPDPDELLALDEALSRLERAEPRRAKVVALKYFGGLTIDEIATALHVATPTVERDWQFAKTWLYREMNKG
jgi:RNA polymerase sigma factor (TIGR02999 family)